MFFYVWLCGRVGRFYRCIACVCQHVDNLVFNQGLNVKVVLMPKFSCKIFNLSKSAENYLWKKSHWYWRCMACNVSNHQTASVPSLGWYSSVVESWLCNCKALGFCAWLCLSEYRHRFKVMAGRNWPPSCDLVHTFFCGHMFYVHFLIVPFFFLPLTYYLILYLWYYVSISMIFCPVYIPKLKYKYGLKFHKLENALIKVYFINSCVKSRVRRYM